MSYAKDTAVTERETQADIRRLLTAHEASEVTVGLNQSGDGVVKFTAASRYGGRAVRMLLRLPVAPRERNRLWRVQLLLLKAKLEAAESGVSRFEDEFLAFLSMPSGRSVAEFMAPKLQDAWMLTQGVTR